MRTEKKTFGGADVESARIRLLTPLELALYRAMSLCPGTVMTREELLKTVWGFRAMGDTRMVDMCVRRLRGKIGADRIQTIYGKGYRLVS